MRRLAAAAVLAAALALAVSASATIKPARGMSGATLGMTPAQVQAKLGPRALKSGRRWYYPTLTLTFRGGRVAEVTTRKMFERLSNGLGVGSTERQLRAAFPRIRCTKWTIFRRCRLGSGSRVTDFDLDRVGVFQITIAQL